MAAPAPPARPASVCVLVLCALLVVMQVYVSIPLAPVVAADLGSGAAATALGLAYFAYAGGFLVFGPLSDRYGRKAVLVPGMAAATLATLALAFAPNVQTVAALRLVQGFAAGSFSPVALAYLREALPGRSAVIAIGAISTTNFVAAITGQVYASAVALAWGWRWVFGLAAAALGVTVLALAAVLREPRRAAEPVSAAQRLRQFTELLTRRRLGRPCLAVFTVLFSFVAMYAALAPHLKDYGLDQSDLIPVRLGALPGVAVAPFAGAWVTRFGDVRIGVAGFALSALGLVGEATSGSSMWALIAASNVFTAGVAVTATAMVTLFSDRAAPLRGAGTSLYGFVLSLGASAGPYTGHLGLGFTALLLVLAAALLTGAALVATGGPGRPRSRAAGGAGGLTRRRVG